MKIKNGYLVVEVDGAERTVPLPTVMADAKVKAWAVPTDYRADGLFVSVTVRGTPEEIPACDLAACKYLGEIDLPADDDAKLEAAKAAKRAEINEAFNAAVASLVASYPEYEIKSWSQQVKEAEALLADPDASVPLLAAIAKARSLPVNELASRVMNKMHAYARASGELIGRRHAAENLIDRAKTLEEVASIVW